MQMVGLHASTLQVRDWQLFVPASVVLGVLFAFLNFVVWLSTVISARDWQNTIYAGDSQFSQRAIVVGVLCLCYLMVDFVRWRRTADRWVGYGYVSYGLTMTLVGAVLLFLLRTMALQ